MSLIVNDPGLENGVITTKDSVENLEIRPRAPPPKATEVAGVNLNWDVALMMMGVPPTGAVLETVAANPDGIPLILAMAARPFTVARPLAAPVPTSFTLNCL